jgi:hypothetical protein
MMKRRNKKGPPPLKISIIVLRQQRLATELASLVLLYVKTPMCEMGKPADNHPREIAPTPTCAVHAAQAITTKMVQRSTMTKRNIRYYNNT